MLKVPGLRSLVLPRVRRHYRNRRFPRADEMTAREYATQFESFSAADYPQLNRAARKPLPRKTLVIFAADDHLVEPQIPTELAAAIPGARAIRHL